MVKETLCVKHTGLAVDNPELVIATKIDLTRHIMSNLDGLQDEIRYALNKELGPCEDWTPSPTYMKLARVIALLSGRVFVGLPLSREEEWIDASVNYTRDVMMAREAIVRRPAIIRHLVAPFLPEVKSVRRYGERGAELLKPVIDEVLARRALGKSYQDDAESEKGTMVSWMLNYAEDKSARTMARNQMSLSFAAIFTTTGAVCHALFDLASRPEYIQPLRDEIQQVINEDGQDITANGFRNFKKQSIPKLRKLDSFLKESQRLSPPAISGMDRVTTAPLKLSTGHTIPKGAHFAFPSYAISVSPKSTMFSPSYNPASYTPPHEFDGFRFYKLRAMEGKENKVCSHLPSPRMNTDEK
jgi:gliotoxin biosynthesis cytochrome P450 monooxygenase